MPAEGKGRDVLFSSRAEALMAAVIVVETVAQTGRHRLTFPDAVVDSGAPVADIVSVNAFFGAVIVVFIVGIVAVVGTRWGRSSPRARAREKEKFPSPSIRMRQGLRSPPCSSCPCFCSSLPSWCCCSSCNWSGGADLDAKMEAEQKCVKATAIRA